ANSSFFEAASNFLYDSQATGSSSDKMRNYISGAVGYGAAAAKDLAKHIKPVNPDTHLLHIDPFNKTFNANPASTNYYAVKNLSKVLGKAVLPVSLAFALKGVSDAVAANNYSDALKITAQTVSAVATGL